MSKRRITIEITEEKDINGETIIQVLCYKGRNYSKVITNTVYKVRNDKEYAPQVVSLSNDIYKHISSTFSKPLEGN